jgi:hypothetical protein
MGRTEQHLHHITDKIDDFFGKRSNARPMEVSRAQILLPVSVTRGQTVRDAILDYGRRKFVELCI